jgi:hypothetical protein
MAFYCERSDQSVRTKCSMCGTAPSETSPLAEFVHWQSDGCNGLVSYCETCAQKHKSPRTSDRR